MADIPKIKTNIHNPSLNTDKLSVANDNSASTIPQVEISNINTEEVSLNPKHTIDFSKIATTKGDVLNGNFISESKINKEYWNPNELTFKEDENGIVTIYRGETILGFTTSQNHPTINNEPNVPQKEEVIEPIEVLEDTPITNTENASNTNTNSSRSFENVPLSYNEIYNVSDNPLTRSKGVVSFNNHKETYYSQKVLPGGGLDIPGRHVAADGTIRDELGYICISARPEYLSRGSTIMTSLGPAKVYDHGTMDVGIIDIYVDW